MTAKAIEDYWKTPRGILERFSMLADDVQFTTFNEAVKTYGLALGASAFRISGNLRHTSCQWCKNHVGRVYRRGQFMPDLPRHPNCNHYYQPIREEAAP